MPTYSTAVTATAAAASAATYATVHTGGSNRAKIRKMVMTTNATTTTNVGLIKSSNTPVATTSTTPIPHDAADHAATTLMDTAWSTAPTIGTNYIETFTLGPAIGAGLTDKWALDEVIILATAVWLVFWNWGGSAGSACTLTAEFDE